MSSNETPDWIIIKNTKYDVTDFSTLHPGGKEMLLSYQGMDATDVFAEFHAPSTGALAMLEKLPVLEREVVSSEDAWTEEIRSLRRTLIQEGRFVPDPVYYTRKACELIALFCLSGWTLSHQHWFLSSVLLGLFYQQSGWLSHDIAHNQVSREHRPFGIFLVGNLAQGFSGTWWIAKHMLHHARPNALDEVTGKPVEDDFDTAPFLYWTSQLVPSSLSPWMKQLLSYQGIYLWGILPWSKFLWDVASFQTAWKKGPWSELLGILLHYALMVGYVRWLLPETPYSVLFTYLWLARIWGGFFIGWVFIQSHNGMTYYPRDTLGYYQAQIMSTRNMSLDRWTTWFTGGLNYQIEHHLFPRIPRHHLPYIADRVRLLCTKHGILYQIKGLFQGSWFLTTYLGKIISGKSI